MITIAILNALSMDRRYRWEAFIDTFLLDQFTYAHKYFKRGKRNGTESETTTITI